MIEVQERDVDILIELYPHNLKAYGVMCAMLDKNHKAAIIHPTGTGKSFIAFKLAEQHSDSQFVWLAPSEHIYHTQLNNIKSISGFVPQNITFLTYAKMMLMNDVERSELRADYIILDEFHRCGAIEWGKGVLSLLATFPNAYLVGLTATNVRYLDNRRDMAVELFDGCVADEMTLGEAIARGILPAPKYVVSLYTYQQELARVERRVSFAAPAARVHAERYLELLRRTLEQAEGLDKVFARHIPNKHGKYIVFCGSVDHIRSLQKKIPDWFEQIDNEPHIYSVWSDSATALEDFESFRQDNSEHLKLLFCVNMFNEGVHVDDIDGVILFRPTISPIIYKQQIGRALSTMKSKTPIIFDAVNNFENLYSISSIQQEMHEFIRHADGNGSIYSDQIEKFEIIDEVRECGTLFRMIERSLATSWELMYEVARQYYEDHGNLLVPSKYVTEDQLPLGQWIQTQRAVYNGTRIEGRLSDSQIHRLESIGMQWQKRSERSWAKGYEHAKGYYAQFGDLNVQSSYVCDDGYELGHWISKMRGRYKTLVKDGMEPENAEWVCELNAIGMIWDKLEESFELYLDAARTYYAKYGDLNVPMDYKTEDGLRLGAWIIEKRMHKMLKNRETPLTDDQVKRLEDVGMEWVDMNERRWNKIYKIVKAYYDRNGSLKMPTNYKEQGIQLWTWLNTQRNLEKRGNLLPERKERLEALNIKWIRKDERWNGCYAKVQEYMANHKGSQMPVTYTTSEGMALGRWLQRQRKALIEGKLDESRASKIRDLDQYCMQNEAMRCSGL